MTQKTQLQGAGDGTAVPAGYVGEKLSGTNIGPTLSVSGSVYNAASLTLPAGVWMVFGHIYVSTIGATLTAVLASISTSSGAHNSLSTAADYSTATGTARFLCPAPLYINTTGQPVYLCASSVYTGTTPGVQTIGTELYAIRL